MSDQRANEIRKRFNAVLNEMRQLGIWDIARPADEAFENMGPFGQHTMAFAQWLRWVFVPRVETLLAEGGPWPSSSEVHIVAMREGDTDPVVRCIVDPLRDFDALFS